MRLRAVASEVSRRWPRRLTLRSRPRARKLKCRLTSISPNYGHPFNSLILNDEYVLGVKTASKKRLREIDRRLRFLTKRIEAARVVDPTTQTNTEQVFFGATITYANSRNEEKTVTIVGIDEANLEKGRISWIAPIARALMKAYEGDTVQLRIPGGIETLEIIEIRYEAVE
ncbi:GreA/GreB family elongation factor [Magnetospirillum sp. J10]|uniref:GreA/GreB family elongation factor n=1 Tax=Magnetospirillum sulfuroxidans TaxID=611300 RepID=A0ABS5IDJ5_9PROT|nr:GreA/GreB family elongation factor [Magnetospirillum sulfuroxidans]